MRLTKWDLSFIEKDLRHGIHELASCLDCSRRREIADRVADELMAYEEEEEKKHNNQEDAL